MDARDYLRNRLGGLLDVLSGTDVREIEVQDGTLTVRLHRSLEEITEPVGNETPSVEPAGSLEPVTIFVVAPLVGTFYSAGKPGMSPLVSEGSRVDEDSVVGIIEALHVLTDVSAGVRGTVSRVLVSDGHPVEYGQRLIEVLVDG
jgi:acetyl-CoA carboxylase biotin carboxyl carrier protein